MTDGFDDIIKQLNDMQQKAHNLSERTEVPILEIYNDKFMSENTDFSSFEEFLEKGNFDIENIEEIEDEVIDAFVAQHSKFNSWDEFLDRAQETWLADQLGF